MFSFFDIVPLDILILILLELSQKDIKGLLSVYPRLETYYANNKANFWLQYYRHNIKDNYRYKSYRQLKRDINKFLPKDIQTDWSYVTGENRYHCNKVIHQAYCNMIEKDILPSKRALCAAYLGKMDILQECLSQGANNYVDMIQCAACTGQEDIVDYLLRFKDSFNDPYWIDICTFTAIEGEQLKMVRKFIEHPDYNSNFFDNAFHVATRIGNQDIIDYLLTTTYQVRDYEELYRIARASTL